MLDTSKCFSPVSKNHTPKVIGALVGVFGFAYVCGVLIADGKMFGGTTPKTCTKEWAEATEKMKTRWPRTAGPTVVLNPISLDNYYVKNRED